jgi:hypothetical protein
MLLGVDAAMDELQELLQVDAHPQRASEREAFGFCAPLVNAPMIAVLTVRTPPSLRPRVMSVTMTLSTVIGPLGFLAAGEALQYVGLSPVFLVVAAGFTLGAVAFAAAIGNGDVAAAAAPASGLAGEQPA